MSDSRQPEAPASHWGDLAVARSLKDPIRSRTRWIESGVLSNCVCRDMRLRHQDLASVGWSQRPSGRSSHSLFIARVGWCHHRQTCYTKHNTKKTSLHIPKVDICVVSSESWRTWPNVGFVEEKKENKCGGHRILKAA